MKRLSKRQRQTIRLIKNKTSLESILSKTSQAIDDSLPITHGHCMLVFNYTAKDALHISATKGVKPEDLLDILQRATSELAKHINVNADNN